MSRLTWQDGYLGKAEDILKSFNLFAYAKGNTVRVDYLPVGTRSPRSTAVIPLEKIIDLNLVSGGDEPAIQAIGVATKKKVTPQSEEVEQTPVNHPSRDAIAAAGLRREQCAASC